MRVAALASMEAQMSHVFPNINPFPVNAALNRAGFAGGSNS
jgi:hypothetical protein